MIKTKTMEKLRTGFFALNHEQLIELYTNAHNVHINAIKELIQQIKKDLETISPTEEWVRPSLRNSIKLLEMQISDYTYQFENCLRNKRTDLICRMLENLSDNKDSRYDFIRNVVGK